MLIVMYYLMTGKMVHTMVAHLDAVTSLAIDPNGLYLLSGSMFYLLANMCNVVVGDGRDEVF